MVWETRRRIVGDARSYRRFAAARRLSTITRHLRPAGLGMELSVLRSVGFLEKKDCREGAAKVRVHSLRGRCYRGEYAQMRRRLSGAVDR